MFERAIEIDKGTGQTSDAAAATHLGNLGMFYFELADTSRAAPLLEEALRLDTAALGPSHPSIATDKMNIARIYMSQGDFTAALALLESAREIVGPEGENSPDLAAVFTLLAPCYAGLHRYSEAKAILRRALDTDDDTFGATSPASVSDRNSLAEVLRNAREFVEADLWYREALCIEGMTRGMIPSIGQGSPRTGRTCTRIGVSTRKQSRS